MQIRYIFVGSTFHVNSDVLLDSRLGRTSANTDDSEKRSDGKPGMWFGPRLGRSLHKYPDLDINKWISFEGKTLKLYHKYYNIHSCAQHNTINSIQLENPTFTWDLIFFSNLQPKFPLYLMSTSFSICNTPGTPNFKFYLTGSV